VELPLSPRQYPSRRSQRGAGILSRDGVNAEWLLQRSDLYAVLLSVSTLEFFDRCFPPVFFLPPAAGTGMAEPASHLSPRSLYLTVGIAFSGLW